MIQYPLYEGVFSLPIDEFRDMSMNVLSIQSLGISLVVSRSELQNGETLQESLDRQMKKLGESMKGFILHECIPVTIGKDKKLTGLQCHNQFKTPEHQLIQYQFAAQINTMMWVISYAKYIPLAEVTPHVSFSAREEKMWQQIKAGFVVADHIS